MTVTAALKILRGTIPLDLKICKETILALVTRHNIPSGNFESLHYLQNISKFSIDPVYDKI